MRIDTRDNACSKFIYTTAKEANDVLIKCKRTSHRSKIPKRKYFCKECHGWHVTSQKNKSKFQ